MVETRNGTQPTNYLHWGEETANVVTTITTTLDEGTVRGVISVGRGVMLDGLGTIGDVAGVLFTLQEKSIGGLTTRDVVTTIGSAGVSIGATALIGAVGTMAAAPGLAVIGVMLFGGYYAGKAAESVFDYMFDPHSRPIVPSIGQGLEEIHDRTFEMLLYGTGVSRLGGGSGDDDLSTPRPSDKAIQDSRDIVAGNHIDPTTGQRTYADAAIRAVAAAQTRREQEIAAAAAAAKAAAEAAAWQQEYNRDRQGGGARLPQPARMSRQNTHFAPRRGRDRIALTMRSLRSVAPIIRVDQERVARQGTHATLMAARGVYWGLNGDG